MRFKKYHADKFAGTEMGSKAVTFQPGMNVVLGNNESGKSTMISAMFHTMFRPAELDKRMEKEFLASCFPKERGKDGSVIDGTVEFTHDGKDIEIYKRWDKKSAKNSAVTVRVDGNTFLGSDAEEALKSAVLADQGFFGNVVMARQNNEQAVLQWFEDAFTEGKEAQETMSAVLSAASGTTIQEYTNALNSEIAALNGRWDDELERPAGCYQRGNGLLVDQYNRVEDIKNAVREYRDTEEKMECKAKHIHDTETLATELAKKLKTYESALENESTRQLLVSAVAEKEEQLRELEQAQHEWQNKEEQLVSVKRLCMELEESMRLEKIGFLKNQMIILRETGSQICFLKEKIRYLKDVEADVEMLQKLENDISTAQAKLSTIMHAKVTFENQASMSVWSDVEGQNHVFENGDEISARGFLDVRLPGIADIRVEPENVDSEAEHRKIVLGREQIAVLLKKYGAETAEEVKQMAAKKRNMEKELVELEMKSCTEGTLDELQATLKELEDAAPAKPITVREDLAEAVASTAPGGDIQTVRMRLEMEVEDYRKKYTSYEVLDQRTEAIRSTYAEMKAKIPESTETGAGTVPLEEKILEIKVQMQDLSAEKDNDIKIIGSCEQKLGGINIDGLLEVCRQEEKELERLKKQYAGYRKIAEDLERVLSEEQSTDEAFIRTFNEYLGRLTAGQVQFGENRQIRSGKNEIPGSQYSRGTRHCILLAFRLALVGYHFPDGDAVIFLDDVLLDMDPERRTSAAELLKEFVGNGNQIIFTTCDTGIAEMLEGNQIRF